MAATKESKLGALYAELSRYGQNGEYERALKAANKLLQEFQDEEQAFHCKVVCLIQLSRFSDALQAITKQPKMSSDLVFEKAYAQYRLNQPQEALKTVSATPNLSMKLKELKAQILYRLERYEDCFDVYRDVIKNSTDDYEEERETNLAAVVANMCLESSTREVPQLREHTYELSYNSACQLIGRGQFGAAEKKLKEAEKLCRETLEDDGVTEEDIEDELGIIKVQLAYCLQRQGREKEAQAIYNAALKQKPDDVGLVAIASNNIVTLNKDQNMFDSRKKIKNATLDGLEHKLTSRQRRNITLNQCLLSVYTNQGDQCQQLCERLVQTYPDTGSESSLIQAVQLSREGKVKEAAAFLQKYGTSHKDQELEMKLASVQLLLSEGERKQSCKILRSLGDSTYKPGIVSTLVTLYLADGSWEEASVILKEAVEWYRKNKINTGDLSMLWRQAADFHLRGGEPAVAARSLEELLRLNPGDKKTLAQLVIAYAQFDPKKAQSLSKELPPVDLPQNIDVETLESTNWMMGSKIIKKTTKVEPSPGSKTGTPGGELIQKKKKKKRKTKLPKNYDPSSTPDPERWLPRHERTGYRKKKDRRNKDVGKGTQGAAAGASDTYDMSKLQNQQQQKPSPVPHSSPAPEQSGPRHQQRKIQQKKKKKSGKW